MDIKRITSPPSIRVYDSNSNYGPHHPSRRPSSQASLPTSTSSMPLAMPNARSEPPPPLPPPRFVDIAAGSDLGWKWGNSGAFEKRDTKLVSPGSSLRGSYGRRNDEKQDNSRLDHIRRGSSSVTMKSPQLEIQDPELKREHSMQDEGYHSLSGSGIPFHQLHGERPLAQRNLEDSSQRYDQQLLKKIGMPDTPPRSSTVGSTTVSPTTRTTFYQSGKQLHQLKSGPTSVSSTSSASTSASPWTATSPFSKWSSSQSSAVSPGRGGSDASMKQFTDGRPDTSESGGPSSASAMLSERFANGLPTRDRRHDSDTALLVNNAKAKSDEDREPGMGRSKRGSMDHANDANSVFAEPDDFPMEETGRMRHLHLDDAGCGYPDILYPHHSHRHSLDSRSGGMKRRASSPLREAEREDNKFPPHSVGNGSEISQRRTSGHHLATSRASPVPNRLHPNHGSVSSTSSTAPRNHSYASSAGISFGSSNTSMSSYDRPSPSGISPPSDQHNNSDSPYVTSGSLDPALDPNPQPSFSQPHLRTSEIKSAAAVARKMSSDNTGSVNQQSSPKLPNAFYCDCCPKKPKKFDTFEELSVHTMEKQYACQWCPNRFKNKNEAERHQNSLHLRKNSWSCAALPGIQAAFHPATSPSLHQNNPPIPDPSTQIPPATDVCGYCGSNFDNYPAPNWDERASHLTTIHKFGECNQSKKFYRADHFRQHLKHSHAGSSGKWTNLLEGACMKEEPNPVLEGATIRPQGAPVANMGANLGGDMQGNLHGIPQGYSQGMPIGPRVGNMNAVGLGYGGDLKSERIEEES